MSDKTTEQLIKEDEQRFFNNAIDDYKENKIEALFSQWIGALFVMEQYLNCPESKACRGIAESCVKYGRELIKKFEELGGE